MHYIVACERGADPNNRPNYAYILYMKFKKLEVERGAPIMNSLMNDRKIVRNLKL